MSRHTRFVLYYRGPSPPPEAHQHRIYATPGLRVIDADSPRLLLVEGPEDEIRNTIRNLEGWTFEPERPMRTGRR